MENFNYLIIGELLTIFSNIKAVFNSFNSVFRNELAMVTLTFFEALLNMVDLLKQILIVKTYCYFYITVHSDSFEALQFYSRSVQGYIEIRHSCCSSL